MSTRERREQKTAAAASANKVNESYCDVSRQREKERESCIIGRQPERERERVEA